MLTRLALTLTAVAATSDVTTRRRLENDWNFEWMSDYTVQYENCFQSDNMVYFRLCPDGSSCAVGCSGGGDYLIDLPMFVATFGEAQMNQHQYACEKARQNCGYDDDSLCYQNAGLQNCGDNANGNWYNNWNGNWNNGDGNGNGNGNWNNGDGNGNWNGENFDVQDYLECKKHDDSGYYIGPYCASDNYNIYLGAFTDEECKQKVDSSYFRNTYGYNIPYSRTSLVNSQCTNCLNYQNNGSGDGENGEGEDQVDVSEQCEELYEASYRCETNLGVDNADVSSCSYIQTLLNKMSGNAGSPASGTTYGGKMLAIMMSLFLGLVLCCACGGCWFCFKQRKQRRIPTNMRRARENFI